VSAVSDPSHSGHAAAKARARAATDRGEHLALLTVSYQHVYKHYVSAVAALAQACDSSVRTRPPTAQSDSPVV
jgi:hypothetical protein